LEPEEGFEPSTFRLRVGEAIFRALREELLD
jgi:hypothetical protein